MARAHHLNPVYLRRCRVKGTNLMIGFYALTAAEQSTVRTIPHPIRGQVRVHTSAEGPAVEVPIRFVRT